MTVVRQWCDSGGCDSGVTASVACFGLNKGLIRAY